jgi:hypothetical protein
MRRYPAQVEYACSQTNPAAQLQLVLAALLLGGPPPHAPRRLYASCKRFSRFFASSVFTGLLTSLGPTPSSSSSEPLPLGLAGGASPSLCSMSLALSPGISPQLSRPGPGAAGTAAEAAGMSCRSASSPSVPASACGALRSRFCSSGHCGICCTAPHPFLFREGCSRLCARRYAAVRPAYREPDQAGCIDAGMQCWTQVQRFKKCEVSNTSQQG